MRHTPEPWHHSGMRYCTITAGNGRQNRIVAVVPCDNQHPATEARAVADARLIVSAPNLLKLGVAVAFEIADYENMTDKAAEVMRQLRLEIAKATGEIQ